MARRFPTPWSKPSSSVPRPGLSPTLESRGPGASSEAHRGTLFLDEVGDLSLMAQAKLLRAIQEREVKHVGGQRTIRVDVRIIAATNRDLAKAVREGEFRDDLYHRLNVISVVIPPLRDRLDDVPRLADHFLHKFASTADRPIRGFSAQARAALLGYKWPGNVRELQHAIERAVVFGDADTILVEDLPPSVQRVPGPDRGTGGQLHHAILDVKRRLVLEALQASSSYSEAAALLGVHPNHLHRLVRNLGLKDEVAAQKGIRSDLRSSGGPENPASTRPR
ncbi:MAG: sigma 54-interacting transcriptional regulator [Vicinamibacterales bacterium]